MTKKEEKETYKIAFDFLELLERQQEHIIRNGIDLTALGFKGAVFLEDAYLIKRYLEADFDLSAEVNINDEYSCPAFFLLLNNYRLFSIIEPYLFDWEESDSNGNSAIFLANDINVIQTLIDNDCDVNAINDGLESPLVFASRDNNIDKARLLLEAGADVNEISGKYSEGTDTTALYEASSKEMIQLLLSFGAKDENVGPRNINRFAKACYNDEVEIIALLKDIDDINEVFVNSENDETCGLHLAVSRDNVRTVKYLLKLKANFNILCNNYSAIQIAAREDSIDSIKVLVEAGAEIDSSDYRISPLILACYNGNTEIVRYLLANGADIDENSFIGTPLIAATKENHEEIIDLLITKNPNFDIKDLDNKTAYDIALEKGFIDVLEKLEEGKERTKTISHAVNFMHLERALKNAERQISEFPEELKESEEYKNIVKEISLMKDQCENYSDFEKFIIGIIQNDVNLCKSLLKNGLSVNSMNSDKQSLLLAAVIKKADKIVKLLLDSGADMYLEDNKGQGPILFACANNYIEIVKLFIENGIDLNHEYSKGSGMLALGIAGAHGFYELCEILINHGADVNKISKGSFFPLYLAAQEGYLDIVKLYRSFGAELKLIKEDVSSLMIAASKGHLDVVEYLLEQGDIIESQTQSAFIFACQNGQKEIAEFLFHEGVNINFVDKDGTALHNAIREKQKEIVQYLLSIGIDTLIVNPEGKLAIDVARENNFSDYEALLDSSNKIQKYDFSNRDLLKGNTAFSKIIAKYGKEIYLDENRKKLLGLISDYLEKDKDFFNVLKVAIEIGILQKLYDVDSSAEFEKRKIVSIILEEIKDSLGISIEKASDLVMIFTNALEWDIL